jgi:hypothetical protein
MNIIRQYINEKFVENSDPVQDLGIGLPTIWKNRIEDYFYKSSLHMKALVFIILVQLIVEMQDQSIVPFIYAKY